MKIKNAFMLGLMSLLLLATTAKAATYTCDSFASCCANLNNRTAGSIVQLTADLDASGFTTLDICSGGSEGFLAASGSNNITFDCQGHTISNVTSSYEDETTYYFVGFEMISDYHTIRNCNFYNNTYYAISMQGSYYNILNSTFRKVGTGIGILGTSGNIIKDSAFDEAGYAINIRGASYNNISDSTFSDAIIIFSESDTSPDNNIIDNITMTGDNYGIYFQKDNYWETENTTANTIRNSRLNNITFNLYNSTDECTEVYCPPHKIVGNFFYNNLINSSTQVNNIGAIQDYGLNYWNTTISNETNIVGGSQKGGNFWAYPNGTGFSQTCDNADNDSFCDSSYTFNPTDYLPLTDNWTYAAPEPPADSYSTSLARYMLLLIPILIAVGIIMLMVRRWQDGTLTVEGAVEMGVVVIVMMALVTVISMII